MSEAKRPTRHTWAARTLAVEPGEQVLEIGCGVGATLAEVVASQGEIGRLVALDRSASMLAAARKTNATAIAEGRVELIEAEWPKVDLGTVRFAKIYAFNVAALWENPSANLPAVRKHLTRGAQGGALYVFHQAPVRAKTTPTLAAIHAALDANGFMVSDTLRWAAMPADVIGVIARVAKAGGNSAR